MNIPRYLTHEMTVPADSDTGGRERDALFLGLIRKQHDLRVLSVDHQLVHFD